MCTYLKQRLQFTNTKNTRKRTIEYNELQIQLNHNPTNKSTKPKLWKSKLKGRWWSWESNGKIHLQALPNNRLRWIPSCSEIWDTVYEVMGCLFEVNKSHKPELKAIYGDNLNVLLWWTLFHDHRVHCAYICQRYHHLLKNTDFQSIQITSISLLKRVHLIQFQCYLPCSNSKLLVQMG